MDSSNPHFREENNISDTFNYINLESFPSRYLETYFKKTAQDELEVAKFLVKEYKKIKGKPKFLDIGCGPTIHHSLPAVPYISQIDMADFLLDNLTQIKNWKYMKNEDMHDWGYFTKLILKLEGKVPSDELIEEREAKLRSLINTIELCDVLNEYPLNKPKYYEAVGCFFCAEEVAMKKSGWEEVMANIASLVSPGGRLFLSALRETDHYSITTHNGEMERLPTAFLKEEYFYEILPKLGFDINESVIEVALTPEEKPYGISSIILLSAKKKRGI